MTAIPLRLAAARVKSRNPAQDPFHRVHRQKDRIDRPIFNGLGQNSGIMMAGDPDEAGQSLGLGLEKASSAPPGPSMAAKSSSVRTSWICQRSR